MKISAEDAKFLKENAEGIIRRYDGSWVYSFKEGPALGDVAFNKTSGWSYHGIGPCSSISELMERYTAAEQETLSTLSEIDGLTIVKTDRFYAQVLVEASFNGKDVGFTYHPNGKWVVEHHRAKKEVQKPTKEVIVEVIADWAKMDHNPGPFFEDQFPYTDND